MKKLLLFALLAIVAGLQSMKAKEAYAVYTNYNTTLTFYYDEQRSNRSGKAYIMNKENTVPGWNAEISPTYVSPVTTVVFDASFKDARPISTFYWFFKFGNLTTIKGIEYLNTSEVTEMCSMFGFCRKLTSIDLIGFNTSQVTTMSGMFYNCDNLQKLDLRSFNTSKVYNMNDMFNACSSLQTIIVGDGWNTNAVEQSSNMFHDCTNLMGEAGTNYVFSHVDASYAHIDGGPSNPGYLSTWNSYVNSPYVELSNGGKTMTFYKDGLRHTRSKTYSLNTGDYAPAWYNDGTYSSITTVVFHSSFANARPTSTAQWFRDMENLTTINGINYLNTENVKYMYRMFSGCKKLEAIDLSGFNTSKVTGMGYLFYDCVGLTTLDVSSFNTSRVQEMYGVFDGCKNLKTIYAGNGWSNASVTNSGNMFAWCQSLVGQQGTTYSPAHEDASYAHIDGGPSNPGYFSLRPYVVLSNDGKTLTFYNDGQMQSHSGKTFYELNQGNNSPRWYTDLSYKNITQIVFDASFSDTRPTSTYAWFRNMTNLTTIRGLNNLNTSFVTNMGQMFYDCNALTSIDLSHFITDNVTNMSDMFANCRALTSLDLSNFCTDNVTNMSLMFYYCNSLKNVNLSSFNTSNVTNMQSMFENCSNLTALDLSSFNTAKVTHLPNMFDNCRALTTIIVSNKWDMSAVTTSTHMFGLCTSIVGGKGTTYNANHIDKEYAHIDGGYSNPGYLTDLGSPYAVLSANGKTFTFYADGKRLQHSERTYAMNENSDTPDWEPDTRGVTKVVFDASFASARPTSTYGWFTNMAQLTTITNLEYLNTSEVDDMSQMFYGCESLVSLDLSHFNTSKVTEMWMMFYECTSLKSLDLTSFNTKKVIVMNEMFSGCTSLNSIDLSSFYTSQTRYMDEMFVNCTSLTTISVGDGWDASHASTDNMFYHCYNIVGELGTTYNSVYDEHVGEDAAHIDWETYPGYFVGPNYLKVPYALLSADGKTLIFYNDGQRATRRMYKTYSTDMATNEEPGWFNDESCWEITHAVFDQSFANARPESTYYWFAQMHKLASIEGMEYLNTSEVISMEGMFEECEALTSLDVSNFDTRNVIIMSGLFNDCCELTTLDVSNFDTRNVTSMYNMFNWCSGLTELDLSNFDTRNVTSMYDMFCSCQSLTSLDLSSFNTANVTRMSSMFEGCDNLTDIDLSTFNTSRVTDLNSMFYGCTALKSLDLSSFCTNNVTNLMAMFRGCTNLQTISVSELWNTDNVTSSNNMFKDCAKLVGGEGTTYNANYIDKAYAHIDGGTSDPGYFTYAPYNNNYTPYAVYYWGIGLLVFLNDGDQESHLNIGQTIYALNEADEVPEWLDDGISGQINEVVFDPSFASARPTTTALWFDSMDSLDDIYGLEYLNTSEVTDMTGMFSKCSEITTLDLRTFNTANVTSMAYMFSGCSHLSVLYLDDLNTANVTNMMGMFNNCVELTNLDLSSFNTANVSDMTGMFYNCSDLCEVIVGNGWSTANATESDEMFSGCINLEGGKGTVYDENHVDKEYARIDGGTSNPGYFTAKPNIRGDVNLDGAVDIADAVCVLNAMAGQQVAGDANVNGDYDDNGNPVIDIADLVTVLNIMAGQ